MVTYFYWRFSALPALEASRNGSIPQTVACEPHVEMDFHKPPVQKIP
jgi:hypothetical protein